MIDVFGIADTLTSGHYELLFLIFIRFSAMAFLLPGISASYIPAQYKLCFAFTMSFAIFPIMIEQSSVSNIPSDSIWSLTIKEAVRGLFIGITIRISVFALQIAGTIIAQSSSIAQIFGGSVSNDAQSTVSNILTISGIALLMTSGFLDQLAVFMLQTYQWQPIHSTVSAAGLLDSIQGSITEGYALAFQMAIPFLALSLFYNMTLGTINRAMPQLLVSFVGAPGIIAASIGLLVISLQPMLQVWLDGMLDISRIFWGP